MSLAVSAKRRAVASAPCRSSGNHMPVNLQSRVIDLRRNLLALGAVVEQRVLSVIEIIRDGDVELARKVRAGDAEIDQMQLDIENECMRLLALGNPVAGDLRLVLTAMRVSNELERIADMPRASPSA